MQNPHPPRTQTHNQASPTPLLPTFIPTSLDPKHHTAVSFQTNEVSSRDPNLSTSAPYLQVLRLPKLHGQPHAPVGQPPDTGKLALNEDMEEDSDDSDYLGNSEEEG